MVDGGGWVVDGWWMGENGDRKLKTVVDRLWL